MLRRYLIRRAVRSTENDRHFELPAGHIPHRRCVVDDLVRGEDREIPSHELDNGPQASHRRTDPDGRKTKFGDRSINDTLIAKLLPQSARHFVGTVVFGNLFAHDENVFVSDYFFS